MINLIYNTHPRFTHASGRPQFLPLWQSIKSIDFQFKTVCPCDLTIVTYNNGPLGYNGKTNGTFEQSLLRAGIDNFHVLGKGITSWINKLKIPLLELFLQDLKTEYILSSDSSDVLLVRGLEGIIDDFRDFNCEMIFNGEKNIWPIDLSGTIIEFEKRAAGDSLFPFLNAGLWIAKTDFIKSKITEIKNYTFQTKHVFSEQIYYKQFYFNHHPLVQVDFKCKIFQNINRVGREILNI